MNHYNKRLQPVRCIICNYKLYIRTDIYCNKCKYYNMYTKIHDYKYPTKKYDTCN